MLHAVLQRHLDTFRTLHVRGHLETEFMGFVTAGSDVFGRHPQDGFADVRSVQDAAGNHQLDEVRVLSGHILNHGHRFFHGLRGAGNRADHVAVRDRDGFVGRQDPGTNLFAAGNPVPDRCVGID